jgi:hypothetical protein
MRGSTHNDAPRGGIPCREGWTRGELTFRLAVQIPADATVGSFKQKLQEQTGVLASLDEGLLSLSLPYSRLYGESL